MAHTYACIYKIEFPNGKYYIGQTNNFKRRYSEYLYGNHKNQQKLHRALVKYKGQITMKPIFKLNECSDKAKVKRVLNALEVMYIKHYDSINNGYNCNSGGGGAIICEETSIKLSKATSCENNPNFGKRHSLDTIEKIRLKGSLRKPTEETMLKIYKSKTLNPIIYQYDLNNNLLNTYYKGFQAIENEIGISRSGISKCCHGLQRTAGGFKWGMEYGIAK